MEQHFESENRKPAPSRLDRQAHRAVRQRGHYHGLLLFQHGHVLVYVISACGVHAKSQGRELLIALSMGL